MKYKILGFSCGNVNNILTWSGSSYHFYNAFKKQCHLVKIIDSYKKNWREEMRKVKEPYDFILQLSFFPLIKQRLLFAPYIDGTHKHLKQECPALNRYARHHDMPVRSFYVPPALIKKERFMFKAASRIFTFSEYTRRSVIQDYQIDPRKVITAGAGANLKRLPKVDKQYDGKTILFIGGDILRKGGHILLEAFRLVKKEIPDARLIMVSSGLKRYSRRKNLERCGIFIKGFANKQALGSLYRKASVFVMPSYYEPFGISFLEAMAYKLPCIGTDKCAMPEIIQHGKTGFLVRPEDPDELSKRIIFLLKHKGIARKMGERGRQRLERYYTWDHVAGRILKAIGTVLAEEKRG